MRHRNDIDGLRALAVLPILLFHAGISTLSGGFVGVDIFFVISGYFITTIILHELHDDSFDILDFYRRRVVRIFPALIFLLVTVLAFAAFWLLPDELTELGRSAAATMGFVANLYFWLTTGYFSGAAEAKGLLHTWSLGVEGQFYLLYPLLLIVLHQYVPKHIGRAILFLTLVSFAISLRFSASDPMAAFYLLPTRAWELGMGALVALGMVPKLESPALRNVAASIGMALAAVAFVVIRADFPFPAPWAMLPCAGAMLLIAYGQDAVTAAPLTWRPVRWIGTISYSLYLWHWPIITFYRLRYGTELTPAATVLLIALSFAAAALSHVCIERPFLRRYRAAAAAPVLIAGGAMLASVVGGSLLIGAQAVAILDYPADVTRVASYADYRARPEYIYQFQRGSCFVGRGQRYDRRNCLRLDAGRPNVVVVGDSHAAQYWRALALRFPGVNVMQATASGCRPTVALEGRARCVDIVAHVLNELTARPGVDGVVLAARWQGDDLPKIVDTVHLLRRRGLMVTVIGPTVEYNGEMPHLLARAMLKGEVGGLERQRLQTRERLDARMKPVIERAGARYFSAVGAECAGSKCRIFDTQGGPFHFDYGHLTLAAARELVREMEPIVVHKPVSPIYDPT